MHPRPTNGSNRRLSDPRWQPDRRGRPPPEGQPARQRRLPGVGQRGTSGSRRPARRVRPPRAGASAHRLRRWGDALEADRRPRAILRARAARQPERLDANIIIAQTQSRRRTASRTAASRSLSASARARARTTPARATLLSYIVRTGTGTDESIWTGLTGTADALSGTSRSRPPGRPSRSRRVTPGAVDQPARRALPIHAGRDRRRERLFRDRADPDGLRRLRRRVPVQDARTRNGELPPLRARRGLPHPCRHGGVERINMRAVPTISGGGAGYTSTGTTKDAIVHFQTTGAVATLTLTADI
jgi:hypothetical protein